MSSSSPSAAQSFFLDRTSKFRHFSMMECLHTTRHKTNQKAHANQLISGKFCSFPAVITVAMSQYHLHGLVANPSGTPSIRILPWLNYNQFISLPNCPLMIYMPQS